MNEQQVQSGSEKQGRRGHRGALTRAMSTGFQKRDQQRATAKRVRLFKKYYKTLRVNGAEEMEAQDESADTQDETTEIQNEQNEQTDTDTTE